MDKRQTLCPPQLWPQRLICRIPYSGTHRRYGVFRSAVNLTAKLQEHRMILVCCVFGVATNEFGRRAEGSNLDRLGNPGTIAEDYVFRHQSRLNNTHGLLN